MLYAVRVELSAEEWERAVEECRQALTPYQDDIEQLPAAKLHEAYLTVMRRALRRHHEWLSSHQAPLPTAASSFSISTTRGKPPVSSGNSWIDLHAAVRKTKRSRNDEAIHRRRCAWHRKDLCVEGRAYRDLEGPKTAGSTVFTVCGIQGGAIPPLTTGVTPARPREPARGRAPPTLTALAARLIGLQMGEGDTQDGPARTFVLSGSCDSVAATVASERQGKRRDGVSVAFL